MRPATPVRSLLPLALVAAMACACTSQSDARAESDDAGPPPHLVALPDGRKLNLRCEGSGSPTVLLESGFGATSAAWFRVQPAVARITRVCAYDRAGYGLSDPAPPPRDGAAIARDLDDALTAAAIEGPFILVGHSAGGLYARLFAARRPGEVKGLVLLDPTVERHAPDPQHDGLEGVRRRVQRCMATSSMRPQPPLSDPAWTGCISSRSSIQATAAALQPDRWADQLSELDTMFERTSDEVSRIGELLKDVPIYVFTASETAAAAPSVGYDKPQSLWELEHVRLALSFYHGWQRTVLSSHLIMIDRPEVVVDAVTAMVGAARGDRRPPGLAPSETATTPGEPAFPESPDLFK